MDLARDGQLGQEEPTHDVLLGFRVEPRGGNSAVVGLSELYCVLPVGSGPGAHLPWSATNALFHESLYGGERPSGL